jgi:DNA-binding HxlR family transcriptional regulator
LEAVEKESLQQIILESEFRRTHKNISARFVNVEFADCPVETSLNILGKKWAMLIIRDIGVYGIDRFNQLLKSLSGIPEKVLATRLKELEGEGFLLRSVERAVPPQVVRWSLTEKGLDAARVGMMMAAFGCKWNADKVFDDKRPRKMHEIYNREGMELLTKDF